MNAETINDWYSRQCVRLATLVYYPLAMAWSWARRRPVSDRLIIASVCRECWRSSRTGLEGQS